MTVEASLPIGNRAFIGREKELSVLDEALSRARAGEGHVVMLAGEPGIGKTSTARHVGERAAARDMLRLWGRCPEAPGAPPYWPWLQVLRQYAAAHDDANLRDAVGPAAGHLVALDAALAPRLPGHEPPSPLADAAEARFRLFDAIAGFVQRAAARKPLLLVFDDLHSADVSSLKLLEFVAGECTSDRVLFLGTYRDGEVVRSHPLSDTLGTLAKLAGTKRLKLAGFSGEETARFVIARGGTPELAAALHERTDGHPLFLAEMARLLDDTRTLHPERALAELQRVPSGVREVIGSRLNRLSPPCIHALGTAAVIGRRFDAELLLSLLDGGSEERCFAALDEARAASLIEDLPEPGRYQFSHALVRDALYDEMAVPRRRRLHHLIATKLEQTHGDDPVWLSALAHHWYAGRSVGTAAKAVEYAARAARHAEEALAHEEAARLYGLALEAIEPAHEAERCTLLLALGDLRTRLGEPDAAVEAFCEAVKLARRAGLPLQLAEAVLGFELAQWRATRPGLFFAALIDEALAAIPPHDSSLRARLLGARCRALAIAEQVDAAVAVHAQAIAMARRLDNPSLLILALTAIAPVRWLPRLRPLRLAMAAEAMALARRSQQPYQVIATLIPFYVGDLMEAGNGEEAANVAEFASDVSSIACLPYVVATTTSCRTMLALHFGRFDEAEKLVTQRAGWAHDPEYVVGAAAVQMFILRREQGQLAELAPVLDRVQRVLPDSALWLPGYVVICCELGHRQQAQAAFERAAAKGLAAGSPADFSSAGSLFFLAEACAWLGDAARARPLYERLLPYAGGGIVFGAHVVSFGSADRALGMLAATMQRWDDAEAHFERAVAFDEASRGWPWLARSRHEYAAMLLRRRRAGDAERAAGLLEAALTATRELGMRALERQVLALQPHAAAPRPGCYPAGLSSREVQVLRMVAEGKTNQEIADALSRSVNTVAHHVRNIIAKAGCANRAEAAAFAVRHGMLKRQ